MTTGATATRRTGTCSTRSPVITMRRACRASASTRRRFSRHRRWTSRGSEAKRMKPSPFVLHRPGTLSQALDLLAGPDNGRVIVGGHSLMPMLNMRLAAPDNLIDLNRIGELAYIRDEGGEIAIGAMTRQRDVEHSPLIAARVPLMQEAILHVGHRQTRNRGTIGGSLCHLDPSAEMPTVMMALDASLLVQSTRGSRVVVMSAFAEGVMTTVLLPDEMLTQIRVRPWTDTH